MGRIATETEARTIGQQGIAENGRMCTKLRALALGCAVASTYADNQLVQYEHLSKAAPKYIEFDILNDTDYSVANQPVISVYDNDNVYLLDKYLVGAGKSTRITIENGKSYTLFVFSQSISEGAPYKLQVLKPGGNWNNSSDVYDYGLAQFTDSLVFWKKQEYFSYRHILK